MAVSVPAMVLWGERAFHSGFGASLKGQGVHF